MPRILCTVVGTAASGRENENIDRSVVRIRQAGVRIIVGFRRARCTTRYEIRIHYNKCINTSITTACDYDIYFLKAIHFFRFFFFVLYREELLYSFLLSFRRRNEFFFFPPDPREIVFFVLCVFRLIHCVFSRVFLHVYV